MNLVDTCSLTVIPGIAQRRPGIQEWNHEELEPRVLAKDQARAVDRGFTVVKKFAHQPFSCGECLDNFLLLSSAKPLATD